MKEGKSDHSVLNQLSEANKKLIDDNKYYIATLAEIILSTVTQNMSQKGHDESVESFNRGNFLELLQFTANHDEYIHTKLNDLPRNDK
jgi:hypothetical protein